ncbi:MAG TPA: hypothetical protein VJ783_03105, partial [Pirellulales bacterium]|nr:hypothetical protein [Pirellulales bacterium]
MADFEPAARVCFESFAAPPRAAVSDFRDGADPDPVQLNTAQPAIATSTTPAIMAAGKTHVGQGSRRATALA